jgi:hypothetical protein
VQALDALRDRVVIGQKTAEPALVHVRHAAALRPLLDVVASLLLGADEEDASSLRRQVRGEVSRLVEQPLGLQQVDDVDPVALAPDVAAHAGVPAPRLVAEVKAGLKQLPDIRLGQFGSPLGCSLAPGGLAGTRLTVAFWAHRPGRAPVVPRQGSVTGRGGS